VSELPVPNGQPQGGATELGEYRLPKRWEGSRVPTWDDPVDLEKDPSPIPDPATTKVPKQLRDEIQALMAKYPDHRSASIPALAAAQRHHGWLPPEAIDEVACVMQVTPAYLTAVASFYDMLDLHSGEPVRSRVYVCTNISCSLAGGRELLATLEGELGDLNDVEVRAFECLGACDIAPMASVDGVYVGPIEGDESKQLADQVRAGDEPLPAKQLIKRKSADPGAKR
jgi:NADH-quinone oxidoreductase subunit E